MLQNFVDFLSDLGEQSVILPHVGSFRFLLAFLALSHCVLMLRIFGNFEFVLILISNVFATCRLVLADV